MFVKATLSDIEKYGGDMYLLALDSHCSCYPTYADGIKSEGDFYAAAERLVRGDSSELLLYVVNGRVEGWVGYFWSVEDKYLQLEFFCVTNGAAHGALSELSKHICARFEGYGAYFGFPSDNSDAADFLKNNGFDIIEEGYNYSFFFESYSEVPDDSHVKRISREHFNDFRSVCIPDDKTYWTPDRILSQLDKWTVITYNNPVPLGAIFAQNGVHSEIFGCEIKSDINYCEIGRALVRAVLNACKRAGAKSLTFICDGSMSKVIAELGFTFVSKYLCFYKTLNTKEDR